MKKYSKLPEGWVVKENGNAPVGYKLISNNKSIFSNEYQNGLLKEKEENNMKTINQLFNETKQYSLDFEDTVFEAIVSLDLITEEDKEIDDYYKFVFELCEKVLVTSYDRGIAIADFAGFIKKNIKEFRAFSIKNWGIEIPEDEEELIYIWVRKLHTYCAGYISEDLFTEFYELLKGSVING